MHDFIVIPAHNEEKHISAVVEGANKYSQHVIVVNDGSTDQTALIAKESGAVVLTHKINLGKGAALKTGCDYAIRCGAQRIVVIDADGQHNPEKIPLFLAALDQDEIVFSYRKKSSVQPAILKFGNNFINKTMHFLFGVDIIDSQCGYRAFTAEAYKKVRWNAADYYMETEMIIKAGKNKLRYSQIPIETIYSDNYKGTTVIDGAKIVLKMLGGKILK